MTYRTSAYRDSWLGNESIRDEFRSPTGERTDVPVLGSTATYDRSELMRRLQVSEYQLADARQDNKRLTAHLAAAIVHAALRDAPPRGT